MPIRAVLFDRDGVLVHVDWQGIHTSLISKLPFASEEMIRRWQHWVHAGGLDDCDGNPDRIGAFLVQLADEVNDAQARAALRRFRISDFMHAYADARPALEVVRKRGLRIGVLSNNTILLGSRNLLALVGLDDVVDVALTAQSLGVSKPEPLAYQRAADALGVGLDECLFFDDNADWVLAARALGIRAFQVDRKGFADRRDVNVVGSLDALPSLLDAL